MVVCIKYLENLDSHIHGLYIIITIDSKKHTNKILLHFKEFLAKVACNNHDFFHDLLSLVLNIELRVVAYIWA
jgi:hypothetical protein